jgi:hypothetical protein
MGTLIPANLRAATASLGEVTVPTESGRTLSMRLWVPDNTAGAKVRGILVATHPSGTEGAGFQQDYRPLALNPQPSYWAETTTTEYNATRRMDLAMQLVAKRHNFALVGLYFSGQHPGGYAANGLNPADVSMMPAQAAALEAGISLLATTYSRPELATAPIAAYGFSGGSGFSLYYAAYNPARCIAVAHNKGGSIGDYDPVYLEAAHQVPVMLSYGENDTNNVEIVKGVFNYHRAKGALWFLIPDYGLAHDSQGYGRFLGAAFFDRIIEKRLPRDWVPGTAPVLRPLAEDSGWLGDHSTWESAASSIVSFAASGATLAGKRAMSWLPDQTMAECWRAISTHQPAGNLTSPVSLLATTKPKQLAYLQAGDSQILGLSVPGGKVLSVDWKDGDVVAGTVSSFPFSLTLTNLSWGIHLVRGQMQLTGGGVSTSELAILLVNPSATNLTPVIQSGPMLQSGPIFAGVPVACSVMASDPDGSIEDLLTYTWSTTAGPATVVFSPANGTNASKEVTANFPVAGSYTLKVAVKDSIGSSTATNATVSVVVTSSPLYSGWASSYNLTGANALDTASPMGDGINNLTKYALGLNPNQFSSVRTDGTLPGLPQFTMEIDSISLLYQKDLSKVDLTYAIETSTDLSNWSTTGATESIQSSSGYIRTTKGTILKGSDTKKFVRLKITRQ